MSTWVPPIAQTGKKKSRRGELSKTREVEGGSKKGRNKGKKKERGREPAVPTKRKNDPEIQGVVRKRLSRSDHKNRTEGHNREAERGAKGGRTREILSRESSRIRGENISKIAENSEREIRRERNN